MYTFFDSEVVEVSLRSIAVSGAATLLSATWSIPLAYLAAKRGWRSLVEAAESLVGVPTVLVGLLLYFIFSKKGVLGFLNLLYTPSAIIIGEAVLVTPLLLSVAHRVFAVSIERYWELAVSLGASEEQAFRLMIAESAPGLLGALVMAFSRAIGELGIALMVGGNIKGLTRTLTTAIALEVSKGEFEKAVSLGAVLVAVMLAAAVLLRLVKRRVEVLQ